MTQPQDIKTTDTGTTTLGIKCSDGVILGADNRTTMGNFVAGKDKQKVRPINDYIGFTWAGAVGDAQMLERTIKANVALYETQRNKRIKLRSLTTFLANIFQERSYFPYWVQTIIGGYDSEPRLIDIDAIGGYKEFTDFTVSGSGSMMAIGVLEAEYTKEKTMKENELLALRAIHAAIERDIYSGNGVDLLFIDKHKSELKHYTLDEVKQIIGAKK
ncbi:MAG: proteasome subunit beta [DPANN group archaeon]|nr:proteasome subunit beta [DPANN group archaeon]